MKMTPAATLAFFASVIKSGAPWTDTCQKAYDEAMAVLRASPTPEGGGEWEEAVALAARIVEEYTMYDFGMSPANKLKLARALLSSPRVEDVRREALEEAAKVADEAQASAREEVASDKEEMGEDYDPYSFGAGFLSGEITASINIATAIRALSLPVVKDTK